MIMEIALGLALATQTVPAPTVTLVLGYGPDQRTETMSVIEARRERVRLKPLGEDMSPAQHQRYVALVLALGTQPQYPCAAPMAAHDQERERWQRQPGSATLTRPCEEE